MLYQRACPSCGGDISDGRLRLGLPCEKCGVKEGGLLREVRGLEEEYENFVDFMKEIIGREPWGPQRFWIKLMLSGESLVINAPTGVGKTTLLAIFALWSQKKGKRVLYVVPSKTLERQIAERYGLKAVTGNYLHKNADKIGTYDIIILDDVDSALKSEKMVINILKTLGMDEVVPLVEEASRNLSKAMRGCEECLKKYVELKEKIRSMRRGQVIIASATAPNHGNVKVKLMLSSLGLKVSKMGSMIREVKDIKIKGKEKLIDVVKTLVEDGRRGIVFVNPGKDISSVVEELIKGGIRAEALKSGKISALKKLEKGEVDVVVAYSSRYGVAARGLDLPNVISFAVFVEPPHRKVSVEKAKKSLGLIYYLAKSIEPELARKLASELRKLTPMQRYLLSLSLKTDISLDDKLNEVKELIAEVAEKVFERDEIKTDRVIVRDGYVILVDYKTYLQASGRTSRLTPEGFTRGLSVVLYDNDEIMELLESALRQYDIRFEDKLDLSFKGKRKVNVKNVLIVVESPTKARTIGRMFSGSSFEFLGIKVSQGTAKIDDEVLFMNIVATKGHIFDLTLDPIGKYGILEDLEPVFAPINRCKRCGYSWASADNTCPKCGAKAESSLEIVNVIRKLSSMVDEVLIATDPDTEGEKIAFDVMLMVRAFNDNVRRITYNEITRKAIIEALKNPRDVDENLVRAQLVRRIDDRLVGFELSQRLWAAFGKKWLGIGRVQGPLLEWVIQRTNEYREKKCYLHKLKLENGDVISVCLKEKKEIKEVKIVDVKEEEVEVSPLPPLTTDELLALSKLPPEKTMRIAQDLFEMGFITYHRTDSTRVSDAGIRVAEEWLKEKGLPFQPRRWGEGGAHEAIRPTRPLEPKELYLLNFQLTQYHIYVYDLIFKRFMASQMPAAKVIKKRITYEVEGIKVVKEFIKEIKEPGWMGLFDIKEKDVQISEKVKVVEAKVRRSSEAPLYTTADLVKMMKMHGIGRPSTYAKAIESLRRHGYIVYSKRKKKVIATKTAFQVYEFLKTEAPEILSVEYTGKLYELMELVASGKLEWKKAVALE